MTPLYHSILLICLCAMPVLAGLDPQSCTVTNSRTDGVDRLLSDTPLYRGQAFSFTNCVALSASGARQDLTDLTITLTIGTLASNVSFSGTALLATAGTWTASGVMPTNWATPYVWLVLSTNSITNIYPRSVIKTQEAP